MGFLFGGVSSQRRIGMYTSLIALALAGISGATPSASWQSYSQASQAVAKERKPLAVFLGTGQNGWEQVAGSLGSEAEKVLAASYLCAYVDTNTPEGKKLTQALEIKNGVGVVLSDRTGENQAYWHDGNLPQTELVRQLVRHSMSTRTSMYPAEDRAVGASSTAMQSGANCLG
jgi:hypothetical protein